LAVLPPNSGVRKHACSIGVGARPNRRGFAFIGFAEGRCLRRFALAVLLSMGLPGHAALSKSEPPLCLLVARRLAPISPNDVGISPRDAETSADIATVEEIDRRNWTHLEAYLRARNVPTTGFKVLRIPNLDFDSQRRPPNASLFFPQDACPEGCDAYVATADGADVTVTPFFYRKHLVAGGRSLIAMALDRRHFVVIRLSDAGTSAGPRPVTVDEAGLDSRLFSASVEEWLMADCLLNDNAILTGN
jgi:hypothetical protein